MFFTELPSPPVLRTKYELIVLVFRSFMSRTERYKRTLKVMNRLLELKQLHKWSPEEYARAENLASDEPIPLNLHTGGMLQHCSEGVAVYSQLVYFQPSHLYSSRKVLSISLNDTENSWPTAES